MSEDRVVPAEVWSDPSQEVTPFDWGSPGARPFGLTELQFRLVQGLLKGLPKYKAAEEAGYKGEGVGLRSTASQACKARAVQAAIAAYRNWEGRADEMEVTPGELKGILSKAIRHPATPGERVQAASLLAKIQANEAEDVRREKLSAKAIHDAFEGIIGDTACQLLCASMGLHPKGWHHGDASVELKGAKEG